MLQVEILTSEAEIESLAAEWRQLQASAGQIPFTGYDWYYAWWAYLAKPAGKTSLVVTGRLNGNLVALFPLGITSKRGIRILENIGREAFYPCDMLLADAAYAAPLWEAVRKNRLYDFADIRTIDAGTPCGKALAGFATLRASDDVFCLDIKWPNGEAWLATRPRNKRTEYRRRTRRLEEQGAIEYHIHTKEAVLPSVAKEMVDYKVEWCKKNAKHGLFDLPGIGEHVNYLLDSTLRDGTFYFAWLTCGGKNIAYEMGMIYRGILYVYIVSSDPAWNPFSVGNLLKTKTMMWAMDSGIKGINTMQGSNQSKLQYTPEIIKCFDYTFSTSLSGHVKETLYVASRALWQKMKKLKAKKPVRPPAANDEETSGKEAA